MTPSFPMSGNNNCDNNLHNVVVIGCGDIAGGYDVKAGGDLVLSHAGAYRIHQGFRITTCVDPDHDHRKSFMDAWDVPSGYDDLEGCLSDGCQFEVASVCAPTSAHGPILERLLETPVKAVFCEKPMTADVELTSRLVDDYEKAGKLICVNYMRRWDPEMTAIREELAGGVWGNVRSVTCFYTKGLRHTGSHMIDLMQYLIGPLSASVVLGRTSDYMQDDPTTDAVLATETNAPVYLIGGDGKDYARFEAVLSCQKGVIEIFDSGYRVRRRGLVSHRHYPGRVHLDEGESKDTGLVRAVALAVENLHDAVTQGTPLVSSGRTALSAEILCHELSSIPVAEEAR